MGNVGTRSNHILDALPVLDRIRVGSLLEQVDLPLGALVHEPRAVQTHAYFPVDSIISILSELRSGASVELGVVGHDGMAGMPIIMGSGISPHRAIVQAAGKALRMKAQYLRDEWERAGPLQQLLMRYNQALTVQMGQTAICNRYHNVFQQLSRWLLMSIDRLPDTDLVMTRGQVANMLGVRRDAVTDAAGELQRKGAIRYQRGRITILDRSRLRQLTCECYELVQNEYQRLLPWDTSATVEQRAFS